MYEGYVADITRTWPVLGKFTEAQKDLYQVLISEEAEFLMGRLF